MPADRIEGVSSKDGHGGPAHGWPELGPELLEPEGIGRLGLLTPPTGHV